MGNSPACQKVASNLRDSLASSQELKNNGVGVPNSTGDAHCFRVSLPFPYPSSHISVSVPPDAYGNRGDDYNEGVPSTYETVLFNNEKLVYNESVGYDDVRRFESTDELVEELVRVSQLYPQKCQEVAETCRKTLLFLSECKQKVQTSSCTSFSFQVKLSLGYPSSYVSVSVPLDANLNGEEDGYVYEFALSNGGGDLVYNAKFGYGDVVRVSSVVEVIEEFERLDNIGRLQLTNVLDEYLVNSVSSLCVEYT